MGSVLEGDGLGDRDLAEEKKKGRGRRKTS